MPNRITLVIGLAVVIIGFPLALSLAQESQQPPRDGHPRDAVVEAQTPRKAPATRPEQRKTEHDRAKTFAAPNAMPSSPAFASQPDDGQTLGFDFYRDPLNA